MPEIVVKFADKLLERIVTEKESISIGRTSDNDIVLDNRGVSRHHARIQFTGGQPEITDLDSLNGTFVNLERISKHSLADDDIIRIGRFDLVFYHDSQAASRQAETSRLIKDNIRQQGTSESESHNPLETLMETRPIPISPGGGAKIERKERR